jgi:hypothetical protein
MNGKGCEEIIHNLICCSTFKFAHNTEENHIRLMSCRFHSEILIQNHLHIKQDCNPFIRLLFGQRGEKYNVCLGI